jgi:hypothetical protein
MRLAPVGDYIVDLKGFERDEGKKATVGFYSSHFA